MGERGREAPQEHARKGEVAISRRELLISQVREMLLISHQES